MTRERQKHRFLFGGGQSSTCVNCGNTVFAEIVVRGTRAQAVLRMRSPKGKWKTPSAVACKR